MKTQEEIERMELLLKKAHELLTKCDESVYVVNPMGVIINYDEAECDGFCLMNDIAELLDLEEVI